MNKKILIIALLAIIFTGNIIFQKTFREVNSIDIHEGRWSIQTSDGGIYYFLL